MASSIRGACYPNKLSNVAIRAIREAVARGTPRTVLADEHRVSRVTIWKHTRDLAPPARRAPWNAKADALHVQKLRQDGLTFRVIGERLGVHPETARSSIPRAHKRGLVGEAR